MRTCPLKIQKLLFSFVFDFNESSWQNEKVKPEKIGRKQVLLNMPLPALAMQKDLVASYLKLLGLKTISFSFIAC